jgi:FtsP/CotA-like multicopper oxidase with cupredoxin domain
MRVWRSWRICSSNKLNRAFWGAAILAALPIIALPAIASEPPVFDSSSSATSPCGQGIAPPGHDAPELWAPATGLTLTVRQDRDRLCYVANGIADAPTIRVRVGSDLTITLRNEITDPEAIDSVTGPGKLTVATARVPASADFLAVVPGMKHHATGATNLHLHGFAVPPVSPQDDVLTVCTDPATGVKRCGRRAFTYHFHVPIGMTEGLYWYHPHVHGEVQAQMLMGLTGAIVVEGPQDDARRAAGIDERVLIVRQMQDMDAGKTQTAAMTAAPPAAMSHGMSATSHGTPEHRAPATAIDTAHELLCGANSGIDALSLNGTPVPVGETDDTVLSTLQMQAGRKQLWRILNAATDAFLDLAIIDETGKPLPLEVIARDGAALKDDAGKALPRIDTLESQAVPPAGRIEMLVTPPPAGVKAYLVTHAVDTGCAGDRLPERRLAVVRSDAPATPAPVAAPVPVTTAAPAAAIPATATPAAASSPAVSKAMLFDGLIARPTARERLIAMAEYPRPGSTDQVDFYIVERKPGAVLKPYEMGSRPAITVRAGTTEEWLIENWTNELHAFHIHQVHFRVLSIDGKSVAEPPLLDVVNVPYAEATGYHSKEGPVRPGRVRIKLYFPESLAGDIPFHCHLVDHEDNGMMGVLRVVKPHLMSKTMSCCP